MAKHTKKSVFKEHFPRSETPMDKTTRVARQMVEDEAEQRRFKMTRLRKARLEREANTPPEITDTKARKTRGTKVATTR